MPRLPIPGADDGAWGDILNSYLSVEHASDGTLKSAGSLSTKADDTNVLHKTGDETVAGIKSFTASPIVPANAFPESAVSGLVAHLAAKESAANKGAVNGYAPLDGAAKVPIANLPLPLTLTFSLTTFFKSGVLIASTGVSRLPIDGAYTIVGVRLMVGTAPGGASIIVDVKKNGTTIFTTQANRPTIAAGANAGGPGNTPDIAALSAGDYLTVDVAQVGATPAGSDLSVSVIVSKSV